MGYPEGTLPSDALSTGVPFDQTRQDMVSMIPDSVRSEPTEDQLRSLLEQMQGDQEAINRRTRSEAPKDGILSLMKPRSTPTVTERMGPLQ